MALKHFWIPRYIDKLLGLFSTLLSHVRISRMQLTRFLSLCTNHNFHHWQAVKQILRYVAGTTHFGIRFISNTDLTLCCFADADWGSDPSDRKSTSGFYIYLGSNLVTWSSKKQAVVSRSTTEAEFRSIASATTELSWMVSLLKELSLSPSAPTIYSDNLGAVLLTANPIFHSKTKHFALDVHYVRDHVRK